MNFVRKYFICFFILFCLGLLSCHQNISGKECSLNDKKKDIDAINNGFITVRIPAKSSIIEKVCIQS